MYESWALNLTLSSQRPVTEISQTLLVTKGARSASLNKKMQIYYHYCREQSKHNTRNWLVADDDYVTEIPYDERKLLHFYIS